MIKSIFGVNVAVQDLEAAAARYEAVLGVAPVSLGSADFAFPGLRGVSFPLGETVINLIASENDNTSVAKFLATRGEGVFLVSLYSDELEADVQSLREKEVRFVLPENAAGSFGKVNFIHPKAMCGVQFEVYQPPGS